MPNLYGLPDELRVEAVDAVRLVTLNRPEDRNPASTAMLFALTDLAGALAQDHDARAVVLTGAGKAFSAGGDFQHFVRTAREPEVAQATFDNSRRFLKAMVDLPIPVIAAVNGAAVGFGATLAALCDIVLMSETAFFAEPHVNIGLVVGDGISITWPFYMSMLKAKEYVFTGDRIPAEDAFRCGLANRIVAPDQLMTEALALAARLAEQPRSALEQSKRLMNMYIKAQMGSVLEAVLDQQFLQTQGADHGRIVQSMIDNQKRNQK